MAVLLSYLQDPIQILVRSRVYEPDEYFESLESWRRGWPETKRDLRERRLREYKEKIKALADGHEIKDRRFYIVVPYWQPELKALMAKARRRPVVTKEKAATQLAQKERQIQAVLWRAGIKTRRLASAEIEELFYYAYDPVMARIQKMRARSAPVREIQVRPLDSNDVATLERRTEDVRQMIVPATLEIRQDHILNPKRQRPYLRAVYVPDFPRDVEGNWLKDVLSLDFNLDVSLHIRPLDAQHARRRLDANERELTGTLGAVADDAPTARDLTERLEDIAYAKEEFRQKSKWFQFSLYFMPYADSLENLERAT